MDFGQTIKLGGCATGRVHGPIHTLFHVSFPFYSSKLLDKLCLLFFGGINLDGSVSW